MKLKPEKKSGLNGIRTHDLCDTGTVLCQLSYQANWELARSHFVSYKLVTGRALHSCRFIVSYCAFRLILTSECGRKEAFSDDP